MGDSATSSQKVDALIVGAGFGGIYQLYSLLQLGLNAKIIDRAPDVGGTWYWNRYPGAMSDTESYLYRFSWDKEDLQTYPWTHHYIQGPEVLKYLRHVVKRHDLRQHISLNTELVSADWYQARGVWDVTTNIGQKFEARYLITALGLLSQPNYPDIPGLDVYQGIKCHTAAWSDDIILKGKRVGVIGCGSTGVQVITKIAKDVQSLHCFQRHPQYTVPSGDGPVSPEYRDKVNRNYDQIIAQARDSNFGFGIVESETPFESVPKEEREAIFETLWSQGGGFRFMSSGFSDIATNKVANEAACEFIRKKIGYIVKDPEKARKLQPRDYYARRPLCDAGYYQQFNLEHVDVIDLKETPIRCFTRQGIMTTDDKEYKLDVVIFATGFDAIDGNYNRVRIRGADGLTLKESWNEEPQSYLGVSVPKFPNMFMILGPRGPFCNIPPAIETQVEFITGLIHHVGQQPSSTDGKSIVIEATSDSEAAWKQVCEKEVEGSLFKETSSWIFGANVPGKKVAVRFYFGGLKGFRAELQKVIDGGYVGFKPPVAA